MSAQAEVAKLQVKLSNLKVRRSYYTLRAPQDGLVTRIKRTGVGENIKEGESVVEFMPLNYELAVEIFVRPVDLPLVQIGQSARIEFDGWPSIVFSGWPSTSFEPLVRKYSRSTMYWTTTANTAYCCEKTRKMWNGPVHCASVLEHVACCFSTMYH